MKHRINALITVVPSLMGCGKLLMHIGLSGAFSVLKQDARFEVFRPELQAFQ